MPTRQIQTAELLLRDVGDGGIGQITVGNDDGTVVHGEQLGGKQGDLLYRSLAGTGGNIVSNTKGLQRQDQHSSCEVCQASLQGQANSQTAEPNTAINEL